MSDTPEEDRLEELDQTIDEARRQATEHGTIDDAEPGHERTLVDPDGDGEPDLPYNAPA